MSTFIGRKANVGIAKEAVRGTPLDPTFWIPKRELTADEKINQVVEESSVSVIEDSVTATMGIPFIRTSVDHGTAFDIAGKNKANPKGLSRALDAAIDMLNGSLR